MAKKPKFSEFIEPLFLLDGKTSILTCAFANFNGDDYNKNPAVSYLSAKNDIAAVIAFLQEYRDSLETLRSYTKEMERLLLWCLHVGKINIASLQRSHLMAYQQFLKNPTPKKLWCGPSRCQLEKDGRINLEWRPFVSGLSDNSAKKAIKILDSFFNYLVQNNYLLGNPLALDRRRKKRLSGPKLIDRYLELDEIQATLTALSDYHDIDHDSRFKTTRARYIILLLFYSGMRIAEAANHKMGNFMQREGNWFLRVIGKGKKYREIPVPDELRLALASFRKEVGLPTPEPIFQEKTPLIPMQNLIQSISPRRIDQILKWAFQLGSNQFLPHSPQKASKLQMASAHWLRHSYVTYLLESGASLKVAQENAGHSDIGTTMLYRHVAQVDRFEATRKLSLKKMVRQVKTE